MAGEGTKRIIDLTEAAETQSGDYIAIDSTGRGTRKLPAGVMATAADLTAEQTARQTADATLDGKITAETQDRLAAENAFGEQITALDEKTEADAALIQNPTKMLSGALCSFTDGAEMPAKSVIVNIEPVQSGTGTPSPDNVRPISGWESVNVYDTGGNLIDVSTNQSGAIDGSGNEVANSVFNRTDFIPINKAKIYVKTSAASGYTMRVHGYSSSKAWVQQLMVINTNGTTLLVGETVPNNVAYVRLSYPVVGVDNTELWQGDTETIPLGRTVYGGEAEIVGGSLTDKMDIVDLGSLTWQYNGSYGAGGAFYSTDKNFGYTPDSEAPNMVCSMYPVKSRNDLHSSADPAFAVSGSGTTRYATVRDTRYTDPMAFKTAMNGVQLVYPIATPQTYQLTPTQINTLLGENNVWSDAGAVEVTYRRDISIVINNLESALNG